MTKLVVMILNLTLLLGFLTNEVSLASTNKAVLEVKGKNILSEDGALQGGASGRITSVLDIRKSAAKDKKAERLVIDLGDSTFQKLQGKLGYYTVEMKKGHRVIVNFTQTLNSKFTERELQKRMQGSSYIQSSKMLFDPMSQTLSLVFDLKKATSLKVVAVNGSKETGKLVLDLTEQKAK